MFGVVKEIRLDSKVIYAMADKATRRILYVGQTAYPHLRRSAHIKRREMASAIMCLIRYTSNADANRIERQVIAAYQKRGQCPFNIRCGKPISDLRLGSPKGDIAFERRWAKAVRVSETLARKMSWTYPGRKQ